MSERFAFGIVAENNARFYASSEIALLVVSADKAVQALQAAVALRESGRRFELALLLEEPKTVHARIFGPEVLRLSQDFDQRRNAYELLDRGRLELHKKPQSQLGQLAAPVARTLADLAALSDGYAVQSWCEYYRVCALLGVRKPPRLTCVPDVQVPGAVPDAAADAIVVWAPDELPGSIGALLFALEEIRRPASIVARPGPLYGLRSALVALEDCAAALTRARVVIDASTHGPAAALAFMERGFTVVCARSSGANEYAPDVRTFDPWSRRSVFAAVIAALGETSSAVYREAKSPSVAPAAPVIVTERAPLVSFIVRTHDRIKLLSRALASAQAQTYPNVEVVVVNDGGDETAIAAVCNEFPRARLTTIARGGIARAGNAGLALATGTYAGMLDDDDLLFPDHAERLVAALERSGALAAYADALNVYLRTIGKDFAITGYRAILVPAIEPTAMLSVCQIVGAARVLFRRDFLLNSGGFNPQCGPADDYEAWMRLVETGDVVRIGAITFLYSQFTDRRNLSASEGSRYADAHRLIYALHPTGRQAVLRQRASIAETLNRHGGLGMFAPVVTLDPQPFLFGPKNGQAG